MRKGTILPIAVMAFAIVAFLLLVDLSISRKKTKVSGNINASTNTSISVNANENVAGDTNVAVNVNSTTNTSTSSSPLEQAVGPYTLGSKPILSVAYYDADASANTLVKVDAENGKILEQATLDLKKSTVVGVAGEPLDGTNIIQFGSDGDSIVFESANFPGMGGEDHPYNGLYRTSFSHPKVIEKIIQYDDAHLLDGDVAVIESFLYNAESGQVAYVTSDTSDPNLNKRTVRITDLKGSTRVLKEYQEGVSVVGFTNHGQNLNVFKTVYPTGTNHNKGQSRMDSLSTVDGRLINSILVYDDSEGGSLGTIDNFPNALAPNLKNYVFWDDVFRTPAVIFRNLQTKKYTSYKNLGGSHNVFINWSNDSGKVFLLTKVVSTTPQTGYTTIQIGSENRYEKYSGKIFDLARGVIDSVDEAIYQFLWSPGPDIIFQKNDKAVFSYNPATKTTIELPFGKRHESNYSGLNWVNR